MRNVGCFFKAAQSRDVLKCVILKKLKYRESVASITSMIQSIATVQTVSNVEIRINISVIWKGSLKSRGQPLRLSERGRFR